MEQILVMMAALVLVGCSKDTPETSQTAEAEPQIASKPTPEPDPISPAEEKVIAIADPIVEKVVRIQLEKPEGELTNADLGNIIGLGLSFTKITDAGLKDLTKLKKLTSLGLSKTKITEEGAAWLRKALPKCNINHSYKKD
ncbi:hypothetical protein OAJ79_04210 [Verrucomicrobia bacterium]|nr:hypothetical protein [Verrucomicrobiota bacterium]